MLDSHIIPSSDWGVYPVLFNLRNISIESYPFFVFLAVLVAIIVFYIESRKQKSFNEKTFYILISALVGGALGAKIPIWIVNYREIINAFPDISPFLSGRTIVGGLIGGTVAVMLVKKYLGINEKRGNLFATAIALGIAIGRIGCFLRGCCYGIQTNLPWGVDFGDGILRHPTQIYESIFAFVMFIYLERKKRNALPGQLFRIFMVSYFTFRFLIEFIRVEEKIFMNLSGYQWASLLVLTYYFFTWEKVKRFINEKLFN